MKHAGDSADQIGMNGINKGLSALAMPDQTRHQRFIRA